MKADDNLYAAAHIFRKKREEYGNNYLTIGKVMEALFPEGINATTSEEWNRLHLLLLSVVKFSRYAFNYKNGGHRDSLTDLIVYIAMLDEMDDEALCKKFLNSETENEKA
jgi:hypothetical protein